MNEMSVYRVGDKILSPGPDQVRFQMSDGGGMLLCAMASPTASEKRNFKNGVPQFRVAFVGGVVFLLYRFGTDPWCDAPFHRALSKWTLPDQIPDGQGIALHCLLVDAATGVLVAQKLAGLSTSASRALISAVRQQPAEIDPDEYTRRVLNLQQMYATKQLLEMAVG